TTPLFSIKKIQRYQSLLIIKNASHFISEITTFPPHQNIGKPLSKQLPKAPSFLMPILMELIEKHRLFPWGESVFSYTPSFYDTHHKTGAIVAKTEIVVGIGKALQMDYTPLKNTTGDTDTDLLEKTISALEKTKTHDFVLLHINGIDEASHRKNTQEKIDFIGKIDRLVLDYCKKNAPATLSITVCADHETCCKTGRHITSSVAYYDL
ncbi:MAG: hypothetical protein RSB96_00300, partial [Oscillospiraceae bacterium]